jgi:hypothetical protein
MKFSHNFNLSHNANDTCTRTTMEVVNPHRQEYQHQYVRKKIIEQIDRYRWGVEDTNHHCRGRSIRDKYCEDNSPGDDQEKRSKIYLAKKDPKDHT